MRIGSWFHMCKREGEMLAQACALFKEGAVSHALDSMCKHDKAR